MTGTSRTPKPDKGIHAFDDPAVTDMVADADAVLSSVPPGKDGDPMLARFRESLAPREGWTGYLSSTGVYGDADGAWVDESAPTGSGRREARSDADAAWRALGDVHIFRLPGIYGPGRSAFERLADGKAQRIDAPGQVFSRVHVEDIAAAVLAALNDPAPGIYNISDDQPAPNHEVIACAARLMDREPPPLIPLEDAQLSPMARGFYAENRRVANGKMKRDLKVRLRYPDYERGLAAIWRETGT
ncbi:MULTISPECIES: Rossmann-fold NAD(P)-binding domain-containing protein [Pacificimonas]|uniref:SDR family NAD(P)-dependent oxidoreductase n=1 Tax=Pacificimonas TaxID=1960290 RepID=UPI001CCA5C59|nr:MULTISPECIES: SDR family NAD(P)-dependent oxidoreductase [Pacificimonas]